MQIAFVIILLCVGLGVVARLSGKPKQVRLIEDAVIRHFINIVQQITSRGNARVHERGSLAQVEQGDLLTK